MIAKSREREMGNFEHDFLTDHSEEALLAEVRRVAEIVNKPTMTLADFERHARVSLSTVRRRFGDWRNILERAGIGNLYSGASVTHRMRSVKTRKMSNDELLGLIREAADKDGTPSISAIRFKSIFPIHRSTFVRRFGGWKNALRLAGLAKSTRKKRYSNEYCYKNIFDLWMHYGRRPYYGELNRPPSRVVGLTYRRRWDTWRKAFAAFLEWANSDEAKRLEWGWDKLAGFGRKSDDE